MSIRQTERVSEERLLTRRQALDWNESWSVTDREMVDAAIEAIEDGTLYMPASAGYMGVRVWGQLAEQTPGSQPRFGVHRALIIFKGWLEWPEAGDPWRRKLDPALFADFREDERDVFDRVAYTIWHPLSTLEGRDSHAAQRQTLALKVCPSCWLAMPSSGVCDDCG